MERLFVKHGFDEMINPFTKLMVHGIFAPFSPLLVICSVLLVVQHNFDKMSFGCEDGEE